MEGEILEIQERLETITEEGTIYPTQKDGNVKWYVWKNGRREYLSKKNDKEIRNLVNKKYLELYLKDTINELRLLETNRKARKKYKTDYAQKMLKQKHYRSILLPVDKKENEETNEKTQVPNPEALKFYTKMGIIVRSKSEVIIATALYDNNIKFEYEKAIKISDVIYYPDFTVEKKNGDIILWEHLGLIDNPDYRNKASLNNNRHIAFKACTAVLVKGFAGTKQTHKSFLNKVIVFIALCRKLSCIYADCVKISYDKLIKSTVITKTHKICKLCVG